MRNLQLNSKIFVCEVCGERADHPATMAIESDRDLICPIQMCQVCGPIDLDVMELCREITIGCTDN